MIFMRARSLMKTLYTYIHVQLHVCVLLDLFAYIHLLSSGSLAREPSTSYLFLLGLSSLILTLNMLSANEYISRSKATFDCLFTMFILQLESSILNDEGSTKYGESPGVRARFLLQN